MDRIHSDFFSRDVLEVAPGLLGAILCRKDEKGIIHRQMITEVEAYRGEKDMACHARAGKTMRTAVMYESGGILYVYLIYGMYTMLNIVTGPAGHPQAVLIRETEDFHGPGILTRDLFIDSSFNKENLDTSDRIWIVAGSKVAYETHSRIGVEYAGDYWKNVPWRFRISNH
ncbi:MAG: DNA-3-methyladenine glycosylase [Chlorobi bacterium]|nr:DNA-3-methyladenine glycosylase [Chlorobiota bacterium]